MDQQEAYLTGLKRLELSDKPVFDQALANLSEPISEYAFASTFLWSQTIDFFWAMLEHHLCLFATGGDLTLLWPPIPQPGATDANRCDAMKHCFEVMDRYNDHFATRQQSRVEYVSEEILNQLKEANALEGLDVKWMAADYVYDTARLISLEGRDLKSKRKAKAKFERDFSEHNTHQLTHADDETCLDLLNRWHADADARHEGQITEDKVEAEHLRDRETVACKSALQHREALGLQGMVLCVGRTMIGFTLAEALSLKMSSILIEKTDRSYPGSPQFIFSEFCKQFWADHPECNVGDDWGIPTLRFTKESYRPIRMLNKYCLARPEES